MRKNERKKYKKKRYRLMARKILMKSLKIQNNYSLIFKEM
jgi:hypothetical protein